MFMCNCCVWALLTIDGLYGFIFYGVFELFFSGMRYIRHRIRVTRKKNHPHCSDEPQLLVESLRLGNYHTWAIPRKSLSQRSNLRWNRNVYIHHCRVHVRLAGIRSGRLGHVGLTWSNHPTCWHFMAFSHPNMAMLNRSIVSGIKGLRYEKGQSHVSFLEIEMLCDFIKKLD